MRAAGFKTKSFAGEMIVLVITKRKLTPLELTVKFQPLHSISVKVLLSNQ